MMKKALSSSEVLSNKVSFLVEQIIIMHGVTTRIFIGGWIVFLMIYDKFTSCFNMGRLCFVVYLK